MFFSQKSEIILRSKQNQEIKLMSIIVKVSDKANKNLMFCWNEYKFVLDLIIKTPCITIYKFFFNKIW